MTIEKSIQLARKHLLASLPDPYLCGSFQDINSGHKEHFITDAINYLILAKNYATKDNHYKPNKDDFRNLAISHGLKISRNKYCDCIIEWKNVKLYVYNICIELHLMGSYSHLHFRMLNGGRSAETSLDFAQYISNNVCLIVDEYDKLQFEHNLRNIMYVIRHKSLPAKIRDSFKQSGLRKIKHKLDDSGITLELNLRREKQGGPWLSHHFKDDEILLTATAMRDISQDIRRVYNYPGYKIHDKSILKDA